MKAINYARLAGLLEGTMTTIPYFVNTPGFKVTDQTAFKNFMKQLINEANAKVEQEAKEISILRPKPWIYNDDFQIDIEQKEENIVVKVNNPYDIRYCSLLINVPPDQEINSFEMECEECILIMENPKIHITGETNIQANTIYLNVENLYTKQFVLQANQGYVQFNQISTESEENSIEFKVRGDIVVQTTLDTNIQFFSDSNTYCFAAPYLQIDNENCENEGILNQLYF